jgi:hypothetical protein
VVTVFGTAATLAAIARASVSYRPLSEILRDAKISDKPIPIREKLTTTRGGEMLNLEHLSQYAAATAVMLDKGYEKEKELQSEIDRLNEQRKAMCQHCHNLLALLSASNALLPPHLQVVPLDLKRAREAKPV